MAQIEELNREFARLHRVLFAIWAAYCRGTKDLVYRGYGLRRPWLVFQGRRS
jgi:hypothetical protein